MSTSRSAKENKSDVFEGIGTCTALHSTPKGPTSSFTTTTEDFSATELVMNSSRGSHLAFLVNKICHVEAVIKIMKRAIVLLVEGMTQPDCK